MFHTDRQRFPSFLLHWECQLKNACQDVKMNFLHTIIFCKYLLYRYWPLQPDISGLICYFNGHPVQFRFWYKTKILRHRIVKDRRQNYLCRWRHPSPNYDDHFFFIIKTRQINRNKCEILAIAINTATYKHCDINTHPAKRNILHSFKYKLQIAKNSCRKITHCNIDCKEKNSSKRFHFLNYYLLRHH